MCQVKEKLMEDINSSAESQNFRDFWMMGGTNLPCPTITNVCKISVFIINKIVQITPLRLQRESLRLHKFLVTNTVLSSPFSQQMQFTSIVNVLNLN